jgi:hypothetical protein
VGVLTGASWPSFLILPEIRRQSPRRSSLHAVRRGSIRAVLRPAIQHAEMIIVSIQNATSSELTRELTARRPGDAIQVCHRSATAMIHRIGREEGIAAGRTSARPARRQIPPDLGQLPSSGSTRTAKRLRLTASLLIWATVWALCDPLRTARCVLLDTASKRS